MWYRIHEHERVDSTSERAFDALAAGTAGHGDVHIAREQTAGRGRLGRSWLSERDEGLYMSAVLLPAPPAPRPTALTMAVALSVHDGLRGLGASVVSIRWPNDLVAEGAKLAGILVETRGLDPVRPHYVVGIGVNVRQQSFPPELLAERPVTSLALLGCSRSVREVAEAVLAPLPERLEQAPERLAREFLAATGLEGVVVDARTANSTWRGVLRALDPRSGLALELEGGQLEQIPLEHLAGLGRPPTP